MSYQVTLLRGAFISDMLGVRTYWEGEAVIWPSEKYPMHSFQVGYFQSPAVGSSAPLRTALRNVLNPIFKLPNNEDQYQGLPVEIDWSKAKQAVIAALGNFQEWAQPIAAFDERDWYRQALEIIKETIDFVLGPGINKDDYRLKWQQIDDPAPK